MLGKVVPTFEKEDGFEMLFNGKTSLVGVSRPKDLKAV